MDWLAREAEDGAWGCGTHPDTSLSWRAGNLQCSRIAFCSPKLFLLQEVALVL